MMANVIITIGDNGKDVPNEVIEAINAMMRSKVKTARATMVVAGVEYIITYSIIEEEDPNELPKSE